MQTLRQWLTECHLLVIRWYPRATRHARGRYTVFTLSRAYHCEGNGLGIILYDPQNDPLVARSIDVSKKLNTNKKRCRFYWTLKLALISIGTGNEIIASDIHAHPSTIDGVGYLFMVGARMRDGTKVSDDGLLFGRSWTALGSEGPKSGRACIHCDSLAACVPNASTSKKSGDIAVVPHSVSTPTISMGALSGAHVGRVARSAVRCTQTSAAVTDVMTIVWKRTQGVIGVCHLSRSMHRIQRIYIRLSLSRSCRTRRYLFPSFWLR